MREMQSTDWPSPRLPILSSEFALERWVSFWKAILWSGRVNLRERVYRHTHTYKSGDGVYSFHFFQEHPAQLSFFSFTSLQTTCYLRGTAFACMKNQLFGSHRTCDRLQSSFAITCTGTKWMGTSRSPIWKAYNLPLPIYTGRRFAMKWWGFSWIILWACNLSAWPNLEENSVRGMIYEHCPWIACMTLGNDSYLDINRVGVIYRWCNSHVLCCFL